MSKEDRMAYSRVLMALSVGLFKEDIELVVVEEESSKLWAGVCAGCGDFIRKEELHFIKKTEDGTIGNVWEKGQRMHIVCAITENGWMNE